MSVSGAGGRDFFERLEWMTALTSVAGAGALLKTGKNVEECVEDERCQRCERTAVRVIAIRV